MEKTERTLSDMQWFKYWAEKYSDLIELCDDEQRSAVLLAISRYCTEKSLPPLDGLAKATFTLMKRDIDESFAIYLARVKNGEKGGRPKTENHT